MANLYCNPLTDNILKSDCGSKRGGLFGEFYVANYGEVDTIESSNNDKNIDTITMLIDPNTTNPYYWYRIVFKKNSAGFNNEAQIGNNKFFNQSVTFAVDGITEQSLATLENMIDGESVWIVKDYNGKTHVLGRVAGLEMSALTYGSGIAADDLYGGTITFLGAEPEMSNLVVSGTQITVLDEDGVNTETVTL